MADSQRIPVNARVDLRQMAALARFFRDRGYSPTSRSHLIHLIVSTFHDLVEHELSRYNTVEDATVALDSMGLGTPTGSAAKRAIVSALQEEDRVAEGVDRISASSADLDLIAEKIRKHLGDSRQKDLFGDAN